MEDTDIVHPERLSLLSGIEEGFRTPAWYGVNLLTSIRRIKAQEASWRIADDHPNIWELVVHCAYWKYVIWRKITGAKRSSFTLKGSDWFPRPLPELRTSELEKAWKSDIALLTEWHEKLVAAASEITASELQAQNLAFYLRGVAQHDVYHIGQIQQIRRLYRTMNA